MQEAEKIVKGVIETYAGGVYKNSGMSEVDYQMAIEAVRQALSKSFQFQLNDIKDLRPFLTRHPNNEMVKDACLHYLGDKCQRCNDGEYTVDNFLAQHKQGYVITLNPDPENPDRVCIDRTNKGFNVFELLGLLEKVQLDLIEQVRGTKKPATVTKTIIE